MVGANTKLMRKNKKSDVYMRKVNMYKDTAVNAMKNVTEFDSKIIESNDEYMEKLTQADSYEYEILKENMAKADTSEERDAIRKHLAEMRKGRFEKDTENKGFCKEEQKSHKNYTKEIIGSVAVVTGLVYAFRKPLMDAGKKLISK